MSNTIPTSQRCPQRPLQTTSRYFLPLPGDTADDGSFQSLKIRLLHIKELKTQVFTFFCYTNQQIGCCSPCWAQYHGKSPLLAAKRLVRLSTRCNAFIVDQTRLSFVPQQAQQCSILTQQSPQGFKGCGANLSFILTNASSPGDSAKGNEGATSQCAKSTSGHPNTCGESFPSCSLT